MLIILSKVSRSDVFADFEVPSVASSVSGGLLSGGDDGDGASLAEGDADWASSPPCGVDVGGAAVFPVATVATAPVEETPSAIGGAGSGKGVGVAGDGSGGAIGAIPA